MPAGSAWCGEHSDLVRSNESVINDSATVRVEVRQSGHVKTLSLDLREQAAEAGIDHILCKPHSPEELADAIQTALDPEPTQLSRKC